MKRFLFLVGLLAFLKWRHDRMDADDKANGYGGYQAVSPISWNS